MDGEGRIARSWRLTRTAWGVIRSDRTVLALAIASALIALCVAATMFWISGWVQHPGRGSLLLGAAITYWPAMLVGTFFGVALAAAAAAALDGRHLTLRRALAVPASRPGQIVLWSLLATGIGLLIQQVISRLPFGGRLAAFVVGTAWSLATLFVIPIL